MERIPYYCSDQETIAYLDGYDAAIVSFEPSNERVLGALPRLEVISHRRGGDRRVRDRTADHGHDCYE